MNKYRNISSTHGLMEDVQHGDNLDSTDSSSAAEFDDHFKFEDAKRKLRIVLCMADGSNFPRFLFLFLYRSHVLAFKMFN